MSETKHTPTPWEFEPDFGDDGAIMEFRKDKGSRYCICQMAGGLPGGPKARIANAELIVRACNAHDELVEALRYAHDHLALDHEGLDGEPDWLLKKIRAALLKAEAKA